MVLPRLVVVVAVVVCVGDAFLSKRSARSPDVPETQGLDGLVCLNRNFSIGLFT